MDSIIRYIHQIAVSLGDPEKRVMDSERAAMTKLRADLLEKNTDS